MDLNSPVGNLPFIGPIYERRLEKLGIKTIEDLLLHVPHRYLDFSLTSDIRSAQVGETLTIKGEVVSMKNQYTRSGKKIQIGEIADSTGKIAVVWFNQPYLVRILYPGTKVSLAGKVDWFGRKRALISPEFEKLPTSGKTLHTGRLIPVYHETSGISSKWLRGRIKEAYDKTERELDEFLPNETLKDLGFPGLAKAVEGVHFPKSLTDSEKGRERLAFNELLLLQLKSTWKKLDWQKNKATYELTVDKDQVAKFISSLPFELTNSQKRTVQEILSDLSRAYPMNRLLEGDVGSGKTVVAAIASFVAFTNGYQSIFMAPTQILAEQHYQTLKNLLSPFGVSISLITSDTRLHSPGAKATGGQVFIGTHALMQQKVNFDKVALVVIDEQHRFGVEQRAHLVKKSGNKKVAPHVLTMTATPIPRTVALTFYGDLDLSTLTEMPKGRQKITTWIVPPQKREGAYQWIKSQITSTKSQIFVVCPLIEQSDKETMQQIKAATSEYENLKKIFKNLTLGLLHGRMKVDAKNKVLGDFRSRRIDILVATPVVEVGIDVPNATIMLIEAAERFGLAQLHQLRGRVGRGEKKSYCLLFSQSTSALSLGRLNAMTKTISGFELAEIDLKLRGPGEIFGTAQHGFPELKIASWGDIKLMKKAKDVAENVFENPQKYPLVLEKLQISQAY